MVAKLVKVLALYMSGLAGPTVGLQEARVFAGNKVTRATCCPLAQKWVLSCTDNGGTSSRILGLERAWPFFPAGRFLSPSARENSLRRRGRRRPSVSSLPAGSKPPLTTTTTPSIWLWPPCRRPTGDTSCFLICRTCCGKIVRENRVICPGGVNGAATRTHRCFFLSLLPSFLSPKGGHSYIARRWMSSERETTWNLRNKSLFIIVLYTTKY